MDYLAASTPAAFAARFRFYTPLPTAFVDVTSQMTHFIAGTGVRTGHVTIQTLHTTTAIVVNEHEPRLLEDFVTLLERLVPAGATYRHDDLDQRPDIAADEPRNGHAHCRALFLPTSATLTIVGGQLCLGRWQRIFLVELDGPRRRDLTAVVVGSPAHASQTSGGGAMARRNPVSDLDGRCRSADTLRDQPEQARACRP